MTYFLEQLFSVYPQSSLGPRGFCQSRDNTFQKQAFLLKGYFSYDQREQCRPIIDKCIYIISLLEYMPPTYARDILFEVLHAPSFNPLMVLKNCPIEYSDAVDHIMIIERNLMSPCLDNVASTCCDNVVNDCCSFKRGSC